MNSSELLFSKNGQGITVRGIRMVLNDYVDDVYSAACIRRLQLLDIEDDVLDRILRRVEISNLIWLHLNKCPSSSLPSSIPLKNLRVLQVSGYQLETLWQDESQAPLQLRELEIFAPGLFNIPKSTGQLKYLERIVIDGYNFLDRYSYPGYANVPMTKLPEEFCGLQSLKDFVLRNCTDMMLLPDSFGDLSNLQYIDLTGCKELARLPKSFGKLTKLKYLDLNGCNKLTLPSEALGKISTLEYINLSGCEKIEILPQQVAHQKSLVTLKLRRTNLKELASAIGELRNLEVLELGSPFLDRLPPSLGNLRNLMVLSICYSRELKCLPPVLGDLRHLKELTIEECEELKCLPSSMGGLRNLKKLSIRSCRELRSLPASVGRLTQLTELYVYGCPLRELPFEKANEAEGESSPTLPRLRELSLGSTKISEIRWVYPNLEILNVSESNDLVKVGTLPNTLQQLSFQGCSNLRKIKRHGCLETLLIDRCPKLETLPPMEMFVSLKCLVVFWCKKQKSIRGLAQLSNLTRLWVIGYS